MTRSHNPLAALLAAGSIVLSPPAALAQPAVPTEVQTPHAVPLGLYDDARLIAWSRDLGAGRRDAALTAVEADLRSGTPHAFAAFTWLEMQAGKRGLKGALAVAEGAPFRRALGVLPEVYGLYREDRFATLVDRFPESRSSEVRDFWALLFLAHAADNANRYADEVRFARLLQQRYPTAFEGYANLLRAAQNDERQRPIVAALVQPGGALAGTPGGRFLERCLQARPLRDLEKAAAADEFMRASARDGRAQLYKAYALRSAWRDDLALPDFQASVRLYPLGKTGPFFDEVAVSLIKAGRLAEARQALTPGAALMAEQANSVGAVLATDMARSLLAAGELGAARRELETALKQWPSHPALRDMFADLELRSQRPAEAEAHARQALAHTPGSLKYQQRLIRSLLEGGKPAEAWAMFEQVKQAHAEPWSDFYNLGGLILDKLKRSDERVENYKRAVEAFPGSTWMQRCLALALADAGRHDEALRTLRSTWSFDEPDAWSLERVAEWEAKRLDGQPYDALPELSMLQKRFPWIQMVWQQEANKIQANNLVEAKAAVWKRAVAANPHSYWAWDGLWGVYSEANRLSEAEALVEQQVAAAQAGSADDRTEALSSAAWMVVRRARRGEADAPGISEGLAKLEAFRSSGGSLGTYHNYRSTLLEAMGHETEAAQAALKAAQAQPDSRDRVLALFNYHSRALGTSALFAQAGRYLERNPFDAERVELVGDFHIKWGGSPIMGLQLLNRLQTLDPQQDTSFLTGMALNQLGDSKRAYVLEYERMSRMSTSDRYVDWFNSTRLKAQQENTTSVKLDDLLKTGTARIIHPDGQIELRRDHPVSGRRELLQIGKAFIRCAYDEAGDKLLSISASSGMRVALTYDAEGRIATMTNNRPAREVSFKYNAAGKPVRIAIKGVGEILVTYNADNELLKVDSPNGRKVALQVTSAFQELLNLIRPFQEARWEVPDLPYEDPQADALRAASERAAQQQDRLKVAQTDLALARYLVAHVGDRKVYEAEARGVLERVYQEGRAAKGAHANQAIESVALWHQLMAGVRDAGLSATDWTSWMEKRTWLTQMTARQDVSLARLRAVMTAVDSKPLKLLDGARWYWRSYLSNPGYYRHFGFAELLPKRFLNAPLQAPLVRRNGDLVVGMGKGLGVFRRGHWERWVYDEALARFRPADGDEEPAALSNVAGVTEDAAGNLWLATAGGLVRISGDYSGLARAWRSPQDGLPTREVRSVTALANAVLVGTAQGLYQLKGDRLSPVSGAADAVTILRATETPGTALVGMASGLFAYRDGTFVRLLGERVDDAVWLAGSRKLFALRDGVLHQWTWDGKAAPNAKERVPDQQNILKSGRDGLIHGLATLPLESGTWGVAVLTDQGMSVYHNGHFEYVDVPELDRRPSVRGLASQGLRTMLVTSEGVTVIERGQAVDDRAGPVADLLSAERQGKTFVARGRELQFVDHQHPQAGAQYWDSVYASHLALDAQGRLIANDGNRIVRYETTYEPANGEADTLFMAEPTVPDGVQTGSDHHVTSLLVASDGAVWVAAGPSVFRWHGDKVDEFNIYKDAKAFPARSDMIARVTETVDHRIWIVASNEGHRSHNGMTLSGGLLEWTGSRFKQLDTEAMGSAWFISSVTPVGEHEAIVGTAAGFARQSGVRYATFEDLKDDSYIQLAEKSPMLWMGTRGARLGEHTWLFGTPEGVMVYNRGRWFNPKRLNWMLPDQHLSQYGSRAVHAVATDPAGRVYAGTDRGLLIYDGGGGDPMAFLMANGFQREVFQGTETEKLHQEADILLPGIRPDSELGRMVGQVNIHKRKIAELDEALKQGVTLPQASSARPEAVAQFPVGQTLSDVKRQALEGERQDQIKASKRALARLEREAPGEFQMLDIKPLDLSALRAELLEEDEALIQYIPLVDRLVLHVLTKDDVPVREVVVPRAQLEKRARQAARALARGADPGRGVVKLGPDGKPEPELTPEALQAELAWLYDQLLRPVEDVIGGKKRIYVSASGPLMYVPFGALVRSTVPRVEYAVERYNFGYLPSMYLLSLVLNHQPLPERGGLVLGDPDGSLPGARREAQVVHSLLGRGAEMALGHEASYQRLVASAGQAGIVHLATHGHLERPTPEDSWLLLAGGYRLSTADVRMLPLKQTEMVVLSACESGLGANGLEFATLARAFAHAGASTIVATLWKVPDSPSEKLMKAFYQNTITKRQDRFMALAEAQRAMLRSSDPADRVPGAWAAYVPFGRP